jgi:hypothetical protein
VPNFRHSFVFRHRELGQNPVFRKGVQEPRLFMYRGRRARRHSFDFRHREVGQYVLSAFSTVGKGITSDYSLPKLFNVLAIHFTEVGCRTQKTHVLWHNLLVPTPPNRIL